MPNVIKGVFGVTVDTQGTQIPEVGLGLPRYNPDTNQWSCEIAICNSATFVTKSSRIWLDASIRRMSCGDSSERIHMIEPMIVKQHLALVEQKHRPVLILDVTLDKDGRFSNVEPRLDRFFNEGMLTVEEFDRLVCEEKIQSLADLITMIELFTSHYPYIYDYQVRWQGSEAVMTQYSVLAAAALGHYMVQQELPAIFVNQRLSTLKAGMYPMEYSVDPLPHEAYSVEVFAPIGTPVRNLASLINMMQINAHLKGSRLPFTGKELVQYAELMNESHSELRVTREKEAVNKSQAVDWKMPPEDDSPGWESCFETIIHSGVISWPTLQQLQQFLREADFPADIITRLLFEANITRKEMIQLRHGAFNRLCKEWWMAPLILFLGESYYGWSPPEIGISDGEGQSKKVVVTMTVAGRDYKSSYDSSDWYAAYCNAILRNICSMQGISTDLHRVRGREQKNQYLLSQLPGDFQQWLDARAQPDGRSVLENAPSTEDVHVKELGFGMQLPAGFCHVAAVVVHNGAAGIVGCAKHSEHRKAQTRAARDLSQRLEKYSQV